MNIYTMIGVLGLIVVVLIICLFLYPLWLLLISLLDTFVNNRLVELNKQKDQLWLAVEDLYEATDDLKERTWDYDDNRKQVRKLTKELSELEEYVLNGDDEDSKSIFAKAVINESKY